MKENFNLIMTISKDFDSREEIIKFLDKFKTEHRPMTVYIPEVTVSEKKGNDR